MTVAKDNLKRQEKEKQALDKENLEIDISKEKQMQ